MKGNITRNCQTDRTMTQYDSAWLIMEEKETEWQPDPSMLSATLSVVSRNKSHIIYDNDSKNNTARPYARGTSSWEFYTVICTRNKF